MLAVIGVFDEDDRDDSRPVRVKSRHGEASEQVVDGKFEPVAVERMQPRQNSVVTRCAVGIVAGVPNRVLVDTSQDDDEPDVAGVEGAFPRRPATGVEQ
jgi:hypothetical protein